MWLAQQGWQVTAVDFSDVLFSPDDVAADLAGSGLLVGRAERVHCTVDTADGERVAIDALVRAQRQGQR